MSGLINTPIDRKNIGLLKLLYGLRQELDIYCLISVNATAINQPCAGKNFWGHIQQLALESIVLKVCKIYEEEKTYPFNSIGGVLRHILKVSPQALDNLKIEEFIRKYSGPTGTAGYTSRLETTVNQFREKYCHELDQLKQCRDKKAAHSEHGITIDSLPPYNVMESLFYFGADFYALVAAAFIGVGPMDLTTSRPVKSSLISLFNDLGFENIVTDMQ